MFNYTPIAFLGNESALFHIATDRPNLQTTFRGFVPDLLFQKALLYPKNIIDLLFFFPFDIEICPDIHLV